MCLTKIKCILLLSHVAPSEFVKSGFLLPNTPTSSGQLQTLRFRHILLFHRFCCVPRQLWERFNKRKQTRVDVTAFSNNRCHIGHFDKWLKLLKGTRLQVLMSQLVKLNSPGAASTRGVSQATISSVIWPSH